MSNWQFQQQPAAFSPAAYAQSNAWGSASSAQPSL
jgi:hypothetical protein